MELARVDDQYYAKIDESAYYALYKALAPLKAWAVAGAVGNWTETWWGNDDVPLLWIRTHTETGKTEYYVISCLVYED